MQKGHRVSVPTTSDGRAQGERGSASLTTWTTCAHDDDSFRPQSNKKEKGKKERDQRLTLMPKVDGRGGVSSDTQKSKSLTSFLDKQSIAKGTIMVGV
ncbi:hypothetical protein V6N13_146205 [Hibiscus sabdariffa]|uniref:Uncharacterized protein n=1 Tax=Hibiscus sabdariffa TaxID=183260 RepID=A0ABR2TSN2_9ROSI